MNLFKIHTQQNYTVFEKKRKNHEKHFIQMRVVTDE